MPCLTWDILLFEILLNMGVGADHAFVPYCDIGRKKFIIVPDDPGIVIIFRQVLPIKFSWEISQSLGLSKGVVPHFLEGFFYRGASGRNQQNGLFGNALFLVTQYH